MDTTSTSVLHRSNVTVSGVPSAATAIVFLHGLGADQTCWHLLAPAFEDRYRVVLLDLVEAGPPAASAPEHPKDGSLGVHADDLLGVLHALALPEVVFVGHSVGALIGLLAAIKEPAQFGRLVLLAPAPRFVHAEDCTGGFEPKDIQELLAAMETNYHGRAQATAPDTLGTEHPELLLELTNSFFQTQPAIAQHFARVAFHTEHHADLPFFTKPTLLLQCAHDAQAPVAVGTYLLENLADSQLVIIDTPGHSAHLTAPQEILHEINKFLQVAPVFT